MCKYGANNVRAALLGLTLLVAPVWILGIHDALLCVIYGPRWTSSSAMEFDLRSMARMGVGQTRKQTSVIYTFLGDIYCGWCMKMSVT